MNLTEYSTTKKLYHAMANSCSDSFRFLSEYLRSSNHTDSPETGQTITRDQPSTFSGRRVHACETSKYANPLILLAENADDIHPRKEQREAIDTESVYKEVFGNSAINHSLTNSSIESALPSEMTEMRTSKDPLLTGFIVQRPHCLTSAKPRSEPGESLAKGRGKTCHGGLGSSPAVMEKRKHPCPKEGCNRIFTRADMLSRHLRVHSGVRPFICRFPDCSRAFARNDHLKDHMLRHAGIKKYRCPLPGCDSFFVRGDELAQHKKRKDHQRFFESMQKTTTD